MKIKHILLVVLMLVMFTACGSGASDSAGTYNPPALDTELTYYADIDIADYGTITVELQDNHFLVHCLDESFVEGLDSGVMVRKLEKMEMRHPVEAPVFSAAASPVNAAPAHNVISDVQKSEEGNADEH